MLFVCLLALIVTIPAYFPNSAGYSGGLLRRHLDLGDRPLHRLHDPGLPALADEGRVQPGPWTLGRKYKWINPIAFVWVALCVIIFCLPVNNPGGVYFKTASAGTSVNYAPIVTIGVMAVVTIWYLVSAQRTFNGPVRTIEFADDGVTVKNPEPEPGLA